MVGCWFFLVFGDNGGDGEDDGDGDDVDDGDGELLGGCCRFWVGCPCILIQFLCFFHRMEFDHRLINFFLFHD